MEAHAHQIGLAGFPWINMSDEEVVLFAQAVDLDAEEFLLQKYEKMVYIWTRSFFLQGAEMYDVIQEGMIGLYKAICDFNDGTSSFWAFAKHKPINDTDGDRILLETLTNSKVSDPETVVIARHQLKETNETIRRFLSEFEFKVFQLYLAGYYYQEISTELEVHTKSIDNALCRVKLKIERNLFNRS